MINNQKNILAYCPNYEKIINFEFLKSDYISERLVAFYKEYIFSVKLDNIEEVKKASSVDKIISKYLEDYIFRKEMKQGLLQIKVKGSASNVLRIIIDSIIKIFERYEEGATRKIYISRWI